MQQLEFRVQRNQLYIKRDINTFHFSTQASHIVQRAEEQKRLNKLYILLMKH